MIVDDDAILRYALCRIVQRAGWTAHEAADGEEATALCPKVKPRVILLDLQMPGKDGFETCAELRADAACRHALIFAISGMAHSAVEDRALRSGFDLCLLKPIDDTLLQMLLTNAARS
jgi:CheY-like chemotaxis protein